ncbi:zinc finger HIT domain-containing protein 2-like [Mercenaria mercenaria]|uniref:zinc finger HIT domain-containing protein 2-like n=1 Tax=Mercenaria mercenaria TaxID=6596 RepID=UPI00234EDE76|nr:zinc finger HIT domain-containing protein 2-like [Mercenaria mercenaria]
MSEVVKLVSEEAVSEEEGRKSACPLCLKSSRKYTCPRCNTPYCSVECYRSDKHRDCSEGFYKDCFMEGLKDYSADPEDKQKVLEMLKRAEADPDLNDLDEPADDLHERLGDLDKDTNEVWNRLTDQEKKEFQVMVGDGRLGNLVEIWSPWWSASPSLVTEVEDSLSGARSPSAVPSILPDIPNISQILKSKPSADVKYNVINVLYVYCYVCRLHNGEQVSMATECAADILALSDVLGQGHTCGSVDEAVQMCMKKLINQQNNYESSPHFNVSILKDIESIIAGTGENEPLKFLLAALSEICQILKKSHKNIAKKLKSEKFAAAKEKYNKSKAKYFQICKKCEFYLSWAQTYGMALTGLVPELQIVHSLLSAELEAVNQSKKQLEEEWGGKVKPRKKKLIEEL